MRLSVSSHLFSFMIAPPPDIYTLSLHDALPIFQWRWTGKGEPSDVVVSLAADPGHRIDTLRCPGSAASEDRKSTRLNSSHITNSYAVFCLKKKITIASRSIAILFFGAPVRGVPF